MLRGIGRATSGARAASAGATQGTATALNSTMAFVDTVAGANTGVRLPVGVPGDVYWVANSGAFILKVYPATGGTINQGVANAAISIADTYTFAVPFVCYEANGWISGAYA